MRILHGQDARGERTEPFGAERRRLRRVKRTGVAGLNEKTSYELAKMVQSAAAALYAERVGVATDGIGLDTPTMVEAARVARMVRKLVALAVCGRDPPHAA